MLMLSTTQIKIFAYSARNFYARKRAVFAARRNPATIADMTFEEQIDTFLGRAPRIAQSAFIAPGAFIAGDVTIGEQASIWPSCSCAGTSRPIIIGDHSNVQDGSVSSMWPDNLPGHHRRLR